MIAGDTGGAPEGAVKELERPLIGDESMYGVIDPDVLWSCTSCGACVNQCPVDIEHVDHIIDMRRYQVLVESNFPAELNQLFKGLEDSGNPWNMSATARMDWAKGLDFEVQVVGEDLESLDSVDWLFWIGCAGAYEDRAKKTMRAVAELLTPGRRLLRRPRQRRDLHRRPGPPGRQRVRLPGPGRAERRDLDGVQGQEGRHDLRALLQHPQERVQRPRPRARGRPPHPAAQPAGPRGQADAGHRRRGGRQAVDHLPRPLLPRPAQRGLRPAARAAPGAARRVVRRDGALARTLLLLRRRRRPDVDGGEPRRADQRQPHQGGRRRPAPTRSRSAARSAG